MAKLFNHQGNDEELTYRLKPYSEERDLKQRIMGITEPEEPTSQKKIYLSETSLDCANVYRSQEPSIPDYATWPLQLAGTSSDEKDHAVPVVLQRDFGMECECDARRDVAELWIENEEKISEDESQSCLEKYRLQLANCVEVET